MTMHLFNASRPRSLGLCIVFAVGSAASLPATLSVSEAAAASMPKSDSFETFFTGKFTGTGAEKDTEHAGTRRVVFSGTGERIPGGVRLAYDVTFSDGEREHKVWTFLKVGPDQYIGRRSDVVGNAKVVQAGNVIQVDYTAVVPTKSGSHNLNFDERFTLTGPRTMVNQLTAKFLFLTVASSQLTLQRIGG